MKEKFRQELFRYLEMIKNIFVLFVLCLSGCIILIEEDLYEEDGYHSHESHTALEHEIWIEGAYVECGPLGWSFDVYVGASYFYHADHLEVGAYADGWDYYPLFYTNAERWRALHESYHYDCDDTVSFIIVASDADGNSDTATLWW